MSSRDLALAIWSVLGLVVVACVALSVVRPATLPTFDTAVRALVSQPARRVIVVLGWMWLGWHLFAR